jgi:hypothetical protein
MSGIPIDRLRAGSSTLRSARRRLTLGQRAGLLLAVVASVSLALTLLLTPGSFSAYVASVKNSSDTAATAPFFTCAAALANDKGSSLFTLPLNEASGSTTATDTASGAYPGTYRGTMTTSTTSPLACSRDTGGAYVLNGSTSYVSTATSVANPQTFSIEVWFKTTVAGGRLIGFGSSQTGASGSYDRQARLRRLQRGDQHDLLDEGRERRNLAPGRRHLLDLGGHEPLPRRRARRLQQHLHRRAELHRLLARRLRLAVGLAERLHQHVLHRQHALRVGVVDDPHPGTGGVPVQRRPLTSTP